MKNRILIFVLIFLSFEIYAQEEPCESHVVFLIDGSSSFSVPNKTLVKNAISTFISNISNNNTYVSVVPLGANLEYNIVYSDTINYVLYDNILSHYDSFFENYINNFSGLNGPNGIGEIDYWYQGLQFVQDELLNHASFLPPDVVILIGDDRPYPLNGTDNGATRTIANNLISNGVSVFYLLNDYWPAGNPDDNIETYTLGYLPSNTINRDLIPDFSIMPSYYLTNNLSNLTDIIGNLENLLVAQNLICDNQPPNEDCESCNSFKPIPLKKYVLSAWAKENLSQQIISYQNVSIEIKFLDVNDDQIIQHQFDPSGRIIEEWQRIYNEFTVPEGTASIEIVLKNKGDAEAFFDDIRIHPYNGNMKSFVYDPQTQRLMAELDENNYSTFYEYDKEGGLVRVKKETEKGVYTIQETRSKTHIAD